VAAIQRGGSEGSGTVVRSFSSLYLLSCAGREKNLVFSKYEKGGRKDCFVRGDSNLRVDEKSDNGVTLRIVYRSRGQQIAVSYTSLSRKKIKGKKREATSYLYDLTTATKHNGLLSVRTGPSDSTSKGEQTTSISWGLGSGSCRRKKRKKVGKSNDGEFYGPQRIGNQGRRPTEKSEVLNCNYAGSFSSAVWGIEGTGQGGREIGHGGGSASKACYSLLLRRLFRVEKEQGKESPILKSKRGISYEGRKALGLCSFNRKRGAGGVGERTVIRGVNGRQEAGSYYEEERKGLFGGARKEDHETTLDQHEIR